MKLNELLMLFPNNSSILSEVEKSVTDELEQSPYEGYIKILDSFFYLFSDDVNNTITIKESNENNKILLLYSEAFKRIRSSSLLAIKGYYIDANSLLRSVFELNKGINAIQNNIIFIDDYFGKRRGEEFYILTEREKDKVVTKYYKSIDDKINNFDDLNIRDDLKESLRVFKSNLHMSVHKSMGNIVLNFRKVAINDDYSNLFYPDSNVKFYESPINNTMFNILMFLKNLSYSNYNYLSDINKDKVRLLSDFIEKSYLESGLKYHSDITKYICEKYTKIE